MTVISRKANAIITVLTCLASIVCAQEVVPQGSGNAEGVKVAFGADLVSAYVYTGVTLNEGPCLQPYMEVSGLPVAIGVWANLDIDDNNDALESGQFSEIDIYGSYDLPLQTEALSVSVSYTEYVYPGSTLEADREACVTLEFDLPLKPVFVVCYGLDGAIKKALSLDIILCREMEFECGINLGINGLVSFVEPGDGDASAGMVCYEAGLTGSYGLFSAGISYIGQGDSDVLPDGPGSYDVSVVGRMGVSVEF